MIKRRRVMTGWKWYNDGEIYREPMFRFEYYLFGWKIWERNVSI